jgi:hypothetical protein
MAGAGGFPPPCSYDVAEIRLELDSQSLRGKDVEQWTIFDPFGVRSATLFALGKYRIALLCTDSIK